MVWVSASPVLLPLDPPELLQAAKSMAPAKADAVRTAPRRRLWKPYVIVSLSSAEDVARWRERSSGALSDLRSLTGLLMPSQVSLLITGINRVNAASQLLPGTPCHECG